MVRGVVMGNGLVQIANKPAARAAVASAPRLYVETYGCQMNVADTDLVRGLFAQQGFAKTDRADDADVILINTCAVRERAEERVFARAEELSAQKRQRRGVVLAITGCMAEHLKEGIAKRAPYVDVVAGPDAYRRITDLVSQARSSETQNTLLDVTLDKDETYSGLDPALGSDGVSGFVTVQRGCDKFCTFCVVPFTRGRERGTSPREILRQVRALAGAGYREVSLLGQTVNSYRYEDVSFADLLRAVARVDGIERVRFTSPYPVDFTDDVIAVLAEEQKVSSHIHLPLQSASDSVLERMRRGYTFGQYETIVTKLRNQVPGIGITTDIMVGFCDETDDDHRQTLRAMQTLSFDSAFMFAYSERSGTQAHRRIADNVAAETKKQRLTEVIRLQESISREVYAGYVGRNERVLLAAVSKRSNEQLIGRTDSFKAVIVPRAEHAPGDVIDVRIERSTSATLFGTPTTTSKPSPRHA